jgi:hypothetical protein
VKLEMATRIDGIVLGSQGARKDLANEVDIGITTNSKFANDFEFPSRVYVICDARLFGRLVGDEAKGFTQERKSLANNVAGRQNIYYVGGNGRANPGGARAGQTGDGVEEGFRSWVKRRRGRRGHGYEVCVHAELLKGYGSENLS